MFRCLKVCTCHCETAAYIDYVDLSAMATVCACEKLCCDNVKACCTDDCSPWCCVQYCTIALVLQNELAILEFIHCLVETLDRYFSNVCELDLMFNLEMVRRCAWSIVNGP